MTIKLGEMLVKEGLITPAQLDECLKCQVIFGGRLGTNLIEMGYLEEQDLARILGRKLGVPCTTPESLMSIPKEVVSLIPRHLVVKYKVVPLQLEKKRLTLAMADPSDIAAIDDISFITGFFIMPVVTPELRLVLALEKYYDIPRETRYINMAGEKRGRDGKEQPASQPQSLARTAAGRKQPVEEPELIELAPLDDHESFTQGYEDHQAPIAVAAAPVPEAVEEEPEILDLIEALSHRLANAADRDEIAEALVAYAGSECERAAILMIKGKTASGWMAMVKGKTSPGFGHLQIPLDSPSVLKVVAEGKSFYLGPIPDTPCNAILLNGLGGGKKESALLMPLLLMGKVVAVLFVDGGAEEMNLRLVELKKIVVKASLAFEILILKNKILSA